MPTPLCLSRSLPAGLFALAILALAPSARAQGLSPKLDSLTQAFMEAHPAVPGLVVGIAMPDGRRVQGYGTTSLADSTRPGVHTRFEIGSVTKVFTALLLAEMAQRGGVDLDDPIGRYLPDSVQAPTYHGRPIRLWHLATHTSGLPRLPGNLNAYAADPYAAYGPRALYVFLDGYELSRAPGAKYAYSNLGAGLLGHLLARRADTSYAALLEQRILRPLGLTETYVPAPGDTTDAQLAQGYTMLGPAPYWRFEALAGAGALRSTAADLLHVLEVQLAPSGSPLTQALRMTHRIRFRSSDRLALGLGWHITPLPRGTQLYWHNGGTGGFRSFIAFAPDAHVGIVVLINAALPLQPFNQFAFQVARTAVRARAAASR